MQGPLVAYRKQPLRFLQSSKSSFGTLLALPWLISHSRMDRWSRMPVGLFLSSARAMPPVAATSAAR